MISDKMQKAINDQINLEFNSAYLYLAMGAHFETQDLPGFASWMKLQWHEEVGHGMRLFDYVNTRGGKVTLGQIDAPKADFDTPMAVFEQVLAHERKVTASIHSLYEVALAEKDYATQSELKWFIDEQVEEEAIAEQIVSELNMMENRPHLTLMMDKKLGKRGQAAG